MRRIFTIIIFITVFVLGLSFSAINIAPVSLNYYLGSLDAPLSIVIIASIVIGIIVGASIIYASTLRLRYENNRLKKKVAIFEQEIDSLRILPIKESF